MLADSREDGGDRLWAVIVHALLAVKIVMVVSTWMPNRSRTARRRCGGDRLCGGKRLLATRSDVFRNDVVQTSFFVRFSLGDPTPFSKGVGTGFIF